jgi:hypothetical protein
VTAAAARDPLVQLAELPEVAEAVDRARRAVDDLRGHRVLRRYAERVASESALRGAWASAALEGADLPLDVVRRTVTAGGRLPEAEEAVVQGALRVAAEVGVAQATWGRAPLQVVARLHTLAAVGSVPEDELGRPLPAAAPRLAALGQLLTTPTAAPALVVAAVAHAELATMGAFATGAAVVARAASRLTLVGRGLDPAAVSVPEVGHAELGREEYAAALAGYVAGGRAGSNGSDGSDGIAAWVVHCAEAVVLGAREGVAICEAIQRGA